jgi:hypothetical protein
MAFDGMHRNNEVDMCMAFDGMHRNNEVDMCMAFDGMHRNSEVDMCMAFDGTHRHNDPNIPDTYVNVPDHTQTYLKHMCKYMHARSCYACAHTCR